MEVTLPLLITVNFSNDCLNVPYTLNFQSIDKEGKHVRDEDVECQLFAVIYSSSSTDQVITQACLGNNYS